MFYSHTFLARKGPLGTVWCAAHLQHKLKKSHYTSTHIPSTVERIMCPEVPIALRMSGHLLLGVVRIYSKKVDYLHHDCNVLWVSLRNAFRPVNVNLPENATHAQVNAVTLPDTYQLDALDFDADLSFDDDGYRDIHLRSQEEITLKDQNPFESELYIRITLDNDIAPDLPRSETSPLPDIDQMQLDIPHQVPPSGDLANQDSDHNKQNEESHERFGEGSSLPDIPIDIEVMRDCRENDNLLLRPDDALVPELNASPYITAEKGSDTPSVEHQDILAPEMPLPQSPQRFGSSSHPTIGAPVVSGSFVIATPEDLSLRLTPSPEKPRRQQRKRKQFFDESLVLTNEFLKNALNDCSNIVKKRKKLPCSALDMWRFINRKKKEHFFLAPQISGMCSDLQNLSSKDLLSLKPESRAPESSAVPIANVAIEQVQSPDHVPVPNFSVEPELLRSPDHDPGRFFRPELVSSPLPLTPLHSQGNAQSFSSPGILGSVSELSGTAIDTEPHRGMFSSSTGSGMKTPITDFEGAIDDFSTALSDIPEMRDSIVSDDLSFLEQDDSPPEPDSLGPREGDTMSVRTRALAQYFRSHSPLSKYSDSTTGDVTLNTILKGRSRKLSARMFYETLVLKDYGLIDVQQEEPYGDITLKLTPTFSTAKI